MSHVVRTDPAPRSVLTAQGISVRFGGLVAVREVSLELAAAEIVSVVGPNGAGKTTLLNAISGLVPMTGVLSVDGAVIASGDAKRVARAGVARSFQSPHLIEHDSALENVLLGAHLRAGHAPWEQVLRRWRTNGIERQLRDEASDLLAEAELGGHDVVRPVSELTHGMRKRVDIVRALMSRPRILLMDEPTAGMGSAERDVIERLMRHARDAHATTVLTVEHHMDVVRRTADRVVAMQTGAVLRSGSVLEVLQSEEFMAATVGRTATESFHHGAADAARTDEGE
jgi:branched-chain amino acid transport system ATP-binding protein